MLTSSLLLWSAVEQKATKSLLTVALVRAVSEKATQAADQLRKLLQGTRQMSSEASLTAVKARDSIISETQVGGTNSCVVAPLETPKLCLASFKV